MERHIRMVTDAVMCKLRVRQHLSLTGEPAQRPMWSAFLVGLLAYTLEIGLIVTPAVFGLALAGFPGGYPDVLFAVGWSLAIGWPLLLEMIAKAPTRGRRPHRRHRHRHRVHRTPLLRAADRGGRAGHRRGRVLDQETARALLHIADTAGARVVYVGDRRQLPAVGRGGVLDIAARWATTHVELAAVHRFRTPDGDLDTEYADLTLRIRSGIDPEAVFDDLNAGGHVQTWDSEADALGHLAVQAAERHLDGVSQAVAVDTNDTAAAVNEVVRDQLVAAGVVDDTTITHGSDGLRIGKGDQVMTRRNDPDLGVANRMSWTVTGIADTGGVQLHSPDRRQDATVDADYVRHYLHLAYATTVHGVQGDTADHADSLLSDSTDGCGAVQWPRPAGCLNGARPGTARGDSRRQATTGPGPPRSGCRHSNPQPPPGTARICKTPTNTGNRHPQPGHHPAARIARSDRGKPRPRTRIARGAPIPLPPPAPSAERVTAGLIGRLRRDMGQLVTGHPAHHRPVPNAVGLPDRRWDIGTHR
jgi:AAA domain